MYSRFSTDPSFESLESMWRLWRSTSNFWLPYIPAQRVSASFSYENPPPVPLNAGPSTSSARAPTKIVEGTSIPGTANGIPMTTSIRHVLPPKLSIDPELSVECAFNCDLTSPADHFAHPQAAC